MIRKIILACVIVPVLNASALHLDQGLLESTDVTQHYWPDTNTITQVKFHDFGMLVIDYVNLHDSIKLRRDYDEYGQIKRSIEVYQKYSSVIYYTIDSTTGETFENVKSGYIDVQHGRFENHGAEFIVGNYQDGIPIGEWTRSDMTVTIVFGFNEKGELSGEYKEYWIYKSNSRGVLKTIGQLKPIDRTQFAGSESSYLFFHPPWTASVRSGEWKYFDQNGKLLQTVTYSEWRP